jgi:hypothetical protein
VASGALAALIWGVTFFLLRIAGLSDQTAAVVAYMLSLFSLGMTALTKYDEIEDVEQAKSEGKRPKGAGRKTRGRGKRRR